MTQKLTGKGMSYGMQLHVSDSSLHQYSFDNPPNEILFHWLTTAMKDGSNNFTFSQGRSSVSRGYDFVFKNMKIQVKANRPSGRRDCAVWNAGRKVKTVGWDILICILYDEAYVAKEAYQFDRDKYERMFLNKKSLRLEDMQKGNMLPI